MNSDSILYNTRWCYFNYFYSTAKVSFSVMSNFWLKCSGDFINWSLNFDNLFCSNYISIVINDIPHVLSMFIWCVQSVLVLILLLLIFPLLYHRLWSLSFLLYLLIIQIPNCLNPHTLNQDWLPFLLSLRHDKSVQLMISGGQLFHSSHFT